MSRRTKKQAKPTRSAERAALELQWRENTQARNTGHEPLPTLHDLFRSKVEPLRPHGDLVCDLYMAGLATQDEFLCAAALQLVEYGICGSDWRKKLADRIAVLPQPYEVMRVVNALDERVETGASERQAAERTAAKFGGGASFDSAAQVVRKLMRRGLPESEITDQDRADFEAMLQRERQR